MATVETRTEKALVVVMSAQTEAGGKRYWMVLQGSDLLLAWGRIGPQTWERPYDGLQYKRKQFRTTEEADAQLLATVDLRTSRGYRISVAPFTFDLPVVFMEAGNFSYIINAAVKDGMAGPPSA